MAGLTGWHFLIVALVILLLFGATRLPALAKGVGQSMKIFKNEMKTDENGKKIPVADAQASTVSTDAPQADSAESQPKS